MLSEPTSTSLVKLPCQTVNSIQQLLFFCNKVSPKILLSSFTHGTHASTLCLEIAINASLWDIQYPGYQTQIYTAKKTSDQIDLSQGTTASLRIPDA